MGSARERAAIGDTSAIPARTAEIVWGRGRLQATVMPNVLRGVAMGAERRDLPNIKPVRHKELLTGGAW